jgi:hypothetical protein
MIDSQDLYHAGLSAIGNDVGCMCDHHFPGAVDATGSNENGYLDKIKFVACLCTVSDLLI